MSRMSYSFQLNRPTPLPSGILLVYRVLNDSLSGNLFCFSGSSMSVSEVKLSALVGGSFQ